MLPDRVSNPGPLTYKSGALPILLRGTACMAPLMHTLSVNAFCMALLVHTLSVNWHHVCSENNERVV